MGSSRGTFPFPKTTSFSPSNPPPPFTPRSSWSLPSHASTPSSRAHTPRTRSIPLPQPDGDSHDGEHTHMHENDTPFPAQSEPRASRTPLSAGDSSSSLASSFDGLKVGGGGESRSTCPSTTPSEGTGDGDGDALVSGQGRQSRDVVGNGRVHAQASTRAKAFGEGWMSASAPSYEYRTGTDMFAAVKGGEGYGMARTGSGGGGSGRDMQDRDDRVETLAPSPAPGSRARTPSMPNLSRSGHDASFDYISEGPDYARPALEDGTNTRSDISDRWRARPLLPTRGSFGGLEVSLEPEYGIPISSGVGAGQQPSAHRMGSFSDGSFSAAGSVGSNAEMSVMPAYLARPPPSLVQGPGIAHSMGPVQGLASGPGPQLAHHKSVPDFEQRRRGSVRFSDELLHYGEDGRAQREGEMERGWRLSSRSMGSLGEGRRNVLVQSLPAGMTAEALQDFASRFGEVVNARVAEDLGLGLGRGSMAGGEGGRMNGYILMRHNEDAAALLSALRAKGHSCELTKEDWQTEYRSREDRNSSNVYVVGLPMDWSKDGVDDYMSQFGRVASLRLLEDKEGNRRGPVLVRFDSRPQAERAINALNGQIHPTSGERMQARVADSDGQKDYKKLRSSAEVAADDRDRKMSFGEDALDTIYDVEHLLRVREKYERRIALINSQIALAAPLDSAYAQTQTQTQTHARNSSSTSSATGFTIGTPNLTSPLGWRQRQLSHTWQDVPTTVTPTKTAMGRTSAFSPFTPPPPPSALASQSPYGVPFPAYAPSGQHEQSPLRASASGSGYASGFGEGVAARDYQAGGTAHGSGNVFGDARGKLWRTRSTRDMGPADMRAGEAGPGEADRTAEPKLLWPN